MSDTAAAASLAFKQALETAARAAIETADPGGVVLYSWGVPDVWPDDVVLFLAVTSTQAPGSASQQKNRDLMLTCEVRVASRRTDQQAAEQRATDLLGWVEHHVRHLDPTLGGAVLGCALTSHHFTGVTPSADMPDGRGCELVATFTARARIPH